MICMIYRTFFRVRSINLACIFNGQTLYIRYVHLNSALFGKGFENKQTPDPAICVVPGYILPFLAQLNVERFATGTWTAETFGSACTRTFKSYPIHSPQRECHKSTRKGRRTHSSGCTEARRDEKRVVIQGKSLEKQGLRCDSPP